MIPVMSHETQRFMRIGQDWITLIQEGDFENATLLQPGILFSSNISTKNESYHIWKTPELESDQRVFIKINSTTASETILSGNLAIFYPQSQNYVEDESVDIENINSDEIWGEFTTDVAGTWFIGFGSLANGTYSIRIFIPTIGYSHEKPLSLDGGFAHADNFTCHQETRFWKLTVVANQRVNLRVYEPPNSNNLEDARLHIYRPSTLGGWDSIEEVDEFSGEDDGVITASWQGEVEPFGVYHIEIVRLPREDWSNPTTRPLGNYYINASLAVTGYSFDTSLELHDNITYRGKVAYNDRYDVINFYRIWVVEGSTVKFSLNETLPNVLDDAIVAIYDPTIPPNPTVIYEERLGEDGKIMGSFYAERTGYYYFKVQPRSSGGIIGEYDILIRITSPGVWNWSTANILITVFFFFILPLCLFIVCVRYPQWSQKLQLGSIFIVIILNSFISSLSLLGMIALIPASVTPLSFAALMIFLLLGALFAIIAFKLPPISPESYEWLVDFEKTTVFNSLAKNPTIPLSAAVPKDKIAFRFGIGPIGVDILLNLIGLAEEGTLIRMKTSRRLWEVSQLFFVGIALYYLISLVMFSLFHETPLPFRVTNPEMITIILPLGVILLAIFIISALYRSFVHDKTNSYVENVFSEISQITEPKKQITDIQARKNLAYVRVLWNQAKKAWREKNYGMFVVKADTATKKLLETRFLQLTRSPLDMEKPQFDEIIRTLRDHGFDLPSNRRIEHYRKTRNAIVHSSKLLDEKEALDTYAHYDKFLARLGLRT